MNSVKTILFDMDGTLLDSRQSVIEAVFKTADHYAPGRFCYSEIEARFGETWDSFTRLLGCPDKDAVVQTYTDFLVGGSEKLIKPFPGVVENLKRLHQQGYKMAIVTNNLRNLAIRSLMFNKIESFFEVVVSIDDVKNGKPHPEPIKKACKHLGVKSNEVLMIGDTIYDLKAARAAGTKCAIVDWYKSYASQLLPDYYFYNIHEFTEIIIPKQKHQTAV